MKKGVVVIITRINKNNEKEFLLASTKTDYGEYTGRHYPPGGKVEENERVEEALIRELKEELNLEINVIKRIAITPADIPDQEIYWYECKITSGKLIIKEDEISDVNYFTIEKVKELNLWPATRKFFEVYYS